LRARWLCLLALLGQSVGCTVTAISQGDDPRPSNTCSVASDCSEGTCRDGLCQTLNGQLEALLIAASPPSNAEAVPVLTFLSTFQDLPTSGGELDLLLPGPSHVVGSLVLPKDETCYPGFMSDDPKISIGPADDGKSLPVTVTMALSKRWLGLSQQAYFASTITRNQKGGYAFDLVVPRGEYDVYLVPPPKQYGCVVPPQLYRNVAIDSENAEATFAISSITRAVVSLRWPKTSRSLTGWRLDVIDSLGGNAISTEAVLEEPVDAGGSAVVYSPSVAYSSVVVLGASNPIKAASDLLRLRPPPGLVAPTIYMDRSGLGLVGSGTANAGASASIIKLDRFTQLPDAVKVEGRLARRDDGAPVQAFVTLVSTEIYGVDAGIFASYQTTVEVGPDGALRAELPPGKYEVQAVPQAAAGISGDALAAVEATWDVPATPAIQYGKLLELRSFPDLSGQTPFVGAQVEALPSPELTLPFDQAFGRAPFVPRASAGLVDESGRFALGVDPGTFDVSVHAPESLGFGRFVKPGLEVKEGDQDLGRVSLPIPAALSGTARVSSGGLEVPLGSALIQAYAYLDKDRAYTRDLKQAVSVVEVAEARADETGKFRLLVPSRIATVR
jgi:hypothetical protein